MKTCPHCGNHEFVVIGHAIAIVIDDKIIDIPVDTFEPDTGYGYICNNCGEEIEQETN